MANAALGDGRLKTDVSTNKTVALSDNGTVQNVTATATITLPATTAGAVFVIRNGGSLVAGNAPGTYSDKGVTITVAPNASDQIAGLGFTATDNKAAINTLGNIGDELTLVGDGTNGWCVLKAVGTWTRQA